MSPFPFRGSVWQSNAKLIFSSLTTSPVIDLNINIMHFNCPKFTCICFVKFLKKVLDFPVSGDLPYVKIAGTHVNAQLRDAV